MALLEYSYMYVLLDNYEIDDGYFSERKHIISFPRSHWDSFFIILFICNFQRAGVVIQDGRMSTAYVSLYNMNVKLSLQHPHRRLHSLSLLSYPNPTIREKWVILLCRCRSICLLVSRLVDQPSSD